MWQEKKCNTTETIFRGELTTSRKLSKYNTAKQNFKQETIGNNVALHGSHDIPIHVLTKLVIVYVHMHVLTNAQKYYTC
jgi:hypothetical protein